MVGRVSGRVAIAENDAVSPVETGVVRSRPLEATTPDEALTTYGAATAPKVYVEIAGANHYGINDVNNPPGAIEQDSIPMLSQPDSAGIVARWTGQFLRAHLLTDDEAETFVYGGDAHGDPVTVMFEL